HDPPLAMRVPMLVAAALCVAIGLWPDAALRLLQRPAQVLAGPATAADPMLDSLFAITPVSLVLLGLVALLALLRSGLLQRREVTAGATWGCGYEAPTSRMQYTAASFAEPVLGPFEGALPRRTDERRPSGYFPRQAHFEQHPGDLAGALVIVPLTRRALALFGRLRIVQHGRVQLYLVYILVTLVVVLLWQLSGVGS